MKCRNCTWLGWECGQAVDSPDVDIERECEIFHQMTNADRIRRMSNEELTEFLIEINEETNWEVCVWCVGHDCPPGDGCTECVNLWLESPCENPSLT